LFSISKNESTKRNAILGGSMNKQVVRGEIKIHSCKKTKVSLEESLGARWLSISGRSKESEVRLTLFFDSQKDTEDMLTFLYNEFGKLQPKTEWLIG